MYITSCMIGRCDRMERTNFCGLVHFAPRVARPLRRFEHYSGSGRQQVFPITRSLLRSAAIHGYRFHPEKRVVSSGNFLFSCRRSIQLHHDAEAKSRPRNEGCKCVNAETTSSGDPSTCFCRFFWQTVTALRCKCRLRCLSPASC